jgi:hypothetical protein
VCATEPVLPARGRELDPHLRILSNRTSFVKRNKERRLGPFFSSFGQRELSAVSTRYKCVWTS